MKKLTLFLFCLLIVLVGTMVVCRKVGILQPTLYYLQIESRDRAANIPVVEAENFDALKLPAYYNCMDTGKLSKTRDQGDLGGCWAFAANAALESRLLPKEQWDFSEDHMIHNNGFYDDGTEGGDFYMAVAYLADWKGPVTEKQDPYNDGKTNPDAKVVKGEGGALILTTSDDAERTRRLEDAGAKVIPLPQKDGHVDLNAALSHLVQEGVLTLMVEGGPRVLAAFIKEKLADWLSLFVAPKRLGRGAGLDGNVDLSFATMQPVGTDFLLEGCFPCSPDL